MPASLVTPEDLAALVREQLQALTDPGRAAGMQAYLKSAMPCLGVTSVPLRHACRTVYADHVLADEEDWHSAVLTLWDGATHREERYAALALARHPRYRVHQQPYTLDLYRHLIVTGAWWDLVDDIATHLVRGLLERHPGPVRPVLLAWTGERDLWLRRTAIVCQVGRGADLDRNLLVTAVEANLDGSTRTTPAWSAYGREFFVRKAIGWALRDHARTDPAWVAAFVAEHGGALSGLSRREALKHLPQP